MLNSHKTKKVKFGDRTLDIDVKFAPLIPLLWKVGIETCRCCQEAYHGTTEIAFGGTGDLCHFLDIAQRRYHIEVESWDEGDSKTLSIAALLLVHFPTEDIPYLVRRFTDAVATVAESG